MEERRREWYRRKEGRGREAISMAANLAGPGDVILLAGKGHETYQEINGVREPFDDVKILSETLQMLHS